MAVLAVTTTSASVAAMVVVGVQGHSAAVPGFRSAAPWPPWFVDSARSPAYVSVALWGAVLLGGIGLATGLLAVRRGWRPRPGWLVAGSFAAVVALTVIPPMGSTDMLDYAVYGRIAASGHSPYRMTPLQLKASGDPVGAVAPHPWATRPSVYGPLATATEWAASELAGGSAARTVFWLKVWNGLAYLALVLALDRLVRSSAARRVRAHVVWSVNPLMLWAVVAGGHIDGLGAALAVAALLTLRRAREMRPEPRRGLLAGVLLGAATAVKASFVLADPGLVWAARRSRATLAAMGLGMLAALVAGYLVAGRAAVSAVIGRASGWPTIYEPWQLLAHALHWDHAPHRIDLLAVAGFVLLAVILLRRLPTGPPDLPSVRPALAVTLAWLITTPVQRPWYDAAIFPLVALMPATRLDWIVVARAVAAALAELPGVTFYAYLHPAWLSAAVGTINTEVVPAALAAAGFTLVWLCASRNWHAADSLGTDAGQPPPHPADSPKRSASQTSLYDA